MSKIKFAVIGCGHIGKRHASMILNNSDFESKIFISSVNEHKRLFEENPWSTHKERHDVMIASNLKYRNLPNDLICLENTNPIIKKRLL